MKTLPCSIERWPAYSLLLDEMLLLPEGARAHWLEALPETFADLKPILKQVLDGVDNALSNDFMVQLPQSEMQPRSMDSLLHTGQRIGPYELLRELGRGGMGVVWLARRIDGAYQLDVALKLPHAHLLTGTVLERFIRERDILASLSHPHIARFYDAGLSDQGQPYIALEAVDGMTLTHWAREHQLNLKQRLALFQQVTQAVEYAHSRLVAHRDLKPANVLVTAKGEVRLLDFGIAKLLVDSGAGDEKLTRADARLATPEYAAPEQLSGGAVTVATDVYALGAMLFELLAGTPPFVAEGRVNRLSLSSLTPEDDSPPLASAHIRATHAQSMGIKPAQLKRALIGDLDAILYKALQYKPEDRYVSVAAFAADLGRYVGSQPIEARRISFQVRLVKMFKRHRLSVIFSTLLGVSIIFGVLGMAWQARVAQAQARRAEAVKEFLLGVFKASDPRAASETPRGQITAKELLDLSAPNIEKSFKGDPEVQIELLRTVADIYRELGEDEAYEKFQARQLDLTLANYGPLHDNVIYGIIEAAIRASGRGDFPACRKLLDKADQSISLAKQNESDMRASWWLNRSVCLRDLPSGAVERETALKNALQLFERFGPKEPGYITTLAEMATEAASQNRWKDSAAINRRAIALALAHPKRNDAELQTLYANLALGSQQLGDLVSAEAAYALSAETARLTSGLGAKAALMPSGKRARTAHLAGDRLKARKLFDELIVALPAVELHDADAQTVREDFGTCLAAEGNAAIAIPLLESVERSWQQTSQFEFNLRRARKSLGDAYDRAGRFADARRVFLLALDDFEKNGKTDSQPVVAMRERWGRFLLDRGEVDAAQIQFDRVLKDALNKKWTHVALAQAGLARVAFARSDNAAALRLSTQAMETWTQRSGFFDIRMEPYLWRVQAASLSASGDKAGAESLRIKAQKASYIYDAPESPTVKNLSYVGM